MSNRDVQRCVEVGHLWVKPILRGNGGLNVQRVCYRCGCVGDGNEPLATVTVGLVRGAEIRMIGVCVEPAKEST